MDTDTPQPAEDQPEPLLHAEVPEEAPDAPSGFPFTFSGVAAFAQTGWGRLLAWQLVMSIALGGGVLLVLGQHWARVIDRAVENHLPPEFGLRAGELIWPDDKPQVFARNAYLCLLVDPAGAQSHGQLADVQIELRRKSWVFRSLFGQVEFDYLQRDVPLTREQFVPWWGSRRPFLLLGAGAAVGLAGWLGGLALGFLFAWPAKLLAWFLDRDPRTGPLWRVAAAAFLPASALLAMGVLCYALRLLPLMGLLVLVPVHLLAGLGWLTGAVFRLPRVDPVAENPFGEDNKLDRDEASESALQPADPLVAAKDEDG